MNCVYVIRCQGYIKIGVSDAPYSRLEALQTACPLQLHLVHFEDFGTRSVAFLVEKAIHEELASRRARGEWFRGQPQHAVRWLKIYHTQHTKLLEEHGPEYWLRDDPEGAEDASLSPELAPSPYEPVRTLPVPLPIVDELDGGRILAHARGPD